MSFFTQMTCGRLFKTARFTLGLCHREQCIKTGLPIQNCIPTTYHCMPSIVQAFIVPCIEQGLNDAEEFIVQRSLATFRALCDLELFGKEELLQVVQKVAPLLCHPRYSIHSLSSEVQYSIVYSWTLAGRSCAELSICRRIRVSRNSSFSCASSHKASSTTRRSSSCNTP